MLRCAGWVCGLLCVLNSAASAQVVADFTADRTLVATPDPIRFTSTSTFPPDPHVSFTWNFGDGEHGFGAAVNHVYDSPGVYTVSLAVHSNGQVSTKTKANLITVVTLTPDFSFSPNYSAVGTVVAFQNLSDTSGHPAQYTWDFGDGQTSTGFNATHAYAAPGFYTVTLKLSTAFAVRTKTQTNALRVRRIEGCATAAEGGVYYISMPDHWSLSLVDVDASLSSDSFTTVQITRGDDTSYSRKLFPEPARPASLSLGALPIYFTPDVALNYAGLKFTGSTPFRLHATAIAPVETDGFAALPVGAWGTEYVVVAMPVSKEPQDASQFSVLAKTFNTSVTITPSIKIGDHEAGVPFTVEVDEFETYLVQALELGQDVTGTIVTADKPVAVFSGNRAAGIPAENDAALSPDYLVEQLLPFDALGRSYVVIPSALRFQDTIRIVAPRSNTDIEITGVITDSISLNRGEFWEALVSGPLRIEATKPVSVMQFANSAETEQAATGDAFMLTVLPAARFSTAYTLKTPLDSRGNPFDNYLTIVAASADAMSGNIFVNGQRVPSGAFSPTPDARYLYTQMQVPHGVQLVDATRPVGVYAYGYGNEHDSYAFPGGCNYCGQVLETPISDDADTLREDFDGYDTNGDGQLQASEAELAGVSLDRFNELDSDQNGFVTLYEVLVVSIGTAPQSPNIFVDFSATSFGDGTLTKPFNSLKEAVAYVLVDGFIHIEAGASSEILRIVKPMSIQSKGSGSVVVGEALEQ